MLGGRDGGVLLEQVVHDGKASVVMVDKVLEILEAIEAVL